MSVETEKPQSVLDRVFAALQAGRRTLPSENRGLPLEWQHPRTRPATAALAEPQADWVPFDAARPPALVANEPNWFRCEFAFPEALAGFPLAGETAYLYIKGGCPFSLWIDGEQAYREEHHWHATGPIADPLTRAIEPGRVCRLTASLEPTAQLPGSSPPSIQIVPRPCQAAADDLETAEYELRFAWALARDDAERVRVSEAAGRVDLGALAAGRWEDFFASVAAMDGALEFLRARAREHTVHILAYGHLDIDWQWAWKDTVMCIRRDVHSALRLMETHPELYMTMSQVPFYRTVAEMDPANYRALLGRVREGRWENTAATWVENDFNMTAGEALVRHLQIAREWGRAELGRVSTILWAPDTFGHPGNLPQFCRLAGLGTYFQSRGAPGGDAAWPARIWEGDDGSEVLALAGGYAGGLGAGIIAYLLRGLPFGIKTGFTVFGCGDHGGGYSRLALDTLERYSGRPVMPRFRFSTTAQLHEALMRERDRLPRTRGFGLNLFEGCYTTHAAAKRDNRRCEQALLEAETFGALAGLDVAGRLRPAWEGVFHNQFHDILCGAAVQESYADAAARSAIALETAGAVTADALRALGGERGEGVTVFNSLGWRRTEVVTVPWLPSSARSMVGAGGLRVPVQHGRDGAWFVARDVPAFGHAVYVPSADVATGGEVTVRETSSHFVVETPLLTACIDRASGVVSSYVDLATGVEQVAYGVPKPRSQVNVTRLDLALNVFQLLDESPNAMPAWLIHNVVREETLLSGAAVRLIEAGPVFARFSVTRAFRSSRIEEELVFFRDLPGLHGRVRIDWREAGSAQAGIPHLKLAFAAAGELSRLLLEGPYTLRSAAPNGQEEVTQNVMALSGPAGGFAVLNDGRYGCDALGSRARISLVRGSYAPDPESDRGRHDVRFAFVPFGPGTSDAWCVKAGAAFNRALRAAPGGAAPWPGTDAVTIDGAPSVVCTALQRDGGVLTLRFFETAGAPCEARVGVGVGLDGAEEVDFTGARLAACAGAGGALRLAFRPFEIKSIRVRTGARQIPKGAQP